MRAGGVRVLALVTDAFGGKGGIAQYNRDFLTALAGCEGVDHVRVVPRHAASVSGPLPPRIEQDRPIAGRLRYSAAALGKARRSQSDTVFCGHLYMAPLALAAARRAKARLIVQLHGIEAWERPTPLQRRGVEAADLVLCVSRFTRARILASCRISPEKVVVLPNTVSSEFSPGAGEALKARWGLARRTILLTVGRLDPAERYKGHDRVIRLLPRLRAEVADLAYVIVGEGEDRARLTALAAEIGVEEAVHFAGAVDFETLKESYRAADLFVMPSTGEGFGIVYLEAMASGTPALGLNVAGAPDALGDGELGIMCSEDELAAAIVSALRKPRLGALELAERTTRRFGSASFEAGVQQLVQRIG